jgi:hypothetical protein
MADFEEASVAAFQRVFDSATVSRCWFHYAQAVYFHLAIFCINMYVVLPYAGTIVLIFILV